MYRNLLMLKRLKFRKLFCDLYVQRIMMLRNYLKLAWRNLLKDRQFSLLNLLGLSVGLACALLIGLWIADEYGLETSLYTPGILAKSLKAEFPEVEDASVVLPASWFNDPTTPSGLLTYGEKKLNATPQLIDSNFFHLFC